MTQLHTETLLPRTRPSPPCRPRAPRRPRPRHRPRPLCHPRRRPASTGLALKRFVSIHVSMGLSMVSGEVFQIKETHWRHCIIDGKIHFSSERYHLICKLHPFGWGLSDGRIPHLGSSRSTGVVSATVSELGGIGAALGLAFGEKYCNSLALRQKHWKIHSFFAKTWMIQMILWMKTGKVQKYN